MATKKKEEELAAPEAQNGYDTSGLENRQQVEEAMAGAGYRPGQSVTNAANALKEWQDKRPEADQSSYQDRINEVLDRAPDTDHMLGDMIHWPDNPEDAWYYEDVQEATNCHTYRWSGSLERWIQITDMRTYADLVRDALRSAR